MSRKENGNIFSSFEILKLFYYIRCWPHFMLSNFPIAEKEAIKNARRVRHLPSVESSARRYHQFISMVVLCLLLFLSFRSTATQNGIAAAATNTPSPPSLSKGSTLFPTLKWTIWSSEGIYISARYFSNLLWLSCWIAGELKIAHCIKFLINFELLT